MSNVTSVSLVCDKCGAHEEPIKIATKVRELRKLCKDKGWKLGKQKDYCPSCSADINEQIRKIREG